MLERHDFAAWERRWAEGREAGRRPYGLEALENRFELVHSDRRWEGATQRVISSLEYRTDRSVGHVVASIGMLRSSQASVAIFENFGLTWSPLARVIPGLPPMLLMSCWMPQRLLTFAHKQRDTFRRLVERSAAVTVFSENQVPIVASVLGVPQSKIRVLDFGVVTDFFTPTSEPTGGYVATVGQDAGRDWPTFFRAAAANPGVRFRLASWPRLMLGHDIPTNVEVLGGLSTVAYRSLLQHADMVVVASHPLPYPTGQSVLLESLACGRPVVTTRSAAMRAYSDNDGVVTCEAGDATALGRVVARLAGDDDRRSEMGAAGRRIAVARFDSRRMWEDVAGLLDEIV